MAGRFSVQAVFKAVDQITRPVRRMQSGVARFTKSAEAGLRRLDKMAGRVSRALGTGIKRGLTVATAAIGGTLATTQRLANEADDLGKRTRDLDFPIEEFQEWRFAAQQSGVAAETFDKSLEAMSRRLGQAQAGTGTMESRLSDLHPELLQAMKDADNSADALAAYRSAMQSVEDPSRRAAITAAIFSNSGQDMQRMAHMTEQELQALMRTQRENGNVTREQADNAEKFNDTVAELTGSLGGLLRDALLPLLPALTELAAGAREWVQANREMVVDRVITFFELIQNNIGQIISWIKRFAATTAVWFALVGAIKAAIAVFTLFNLVLAANPIVLIVVGVVALIAALVALGLWLHKVIDWTGLFSRVGERAANYFASSWESLVSFLTSIWNRYVAFWGASWDVIMAVVTPVADFIASAWRGMVATLTAAWNAYVAFWGALWDGIMAVVVPVAGFIGTAVGGLVDGLKASWSSFGDFWAGLWEGIKSTVFAVIDFIQPAIDSVMGSVNKLLGGAKAVGNFFGIGGGDEDDEPSSRGGRAGRGRPPAAMTTPQERTAREVSETRTEDHSTVTIRDETGRAEQTGGRRGRGPGLVTLEPSGAF